jgi:RND family efflux transporter MFP subunit
MTFSNSLFGGILIGAFGVGALVLTYTHVSNNRNTGAVAGAMTEVPERPVFSVQVSVAGISTLEQRVTATGRARASREAPIFTRVGGIVRQVSLIDGMHVGKGDLLFKLDDREHRIALREAEDRLLERQIEYNIMKAGPTPDPGDNPAIRALIAELEETLRKSGRAYEQGELDERELIHIRREYEAALSYLTARREEVIANKSGLAQAEQALERARLNVSYSEVHAPFDGYVAQLDVQEGVYVQPGKEYLKIVDLFTMYVEVGVLESELPFIRKGSGVLVSFPALPERVWEGKVQSVSPFIDSETRTARILISIDNPRGDIKAGMYANVEIVTDEVTGVLVVPRKAILVRDRRELVFRIEENTAKWQYVTTGKRNPNTFRLLKDYRRATRSQSEDIIPSPTTPG